MQALNQISKHAELPHTRRHARKWLDSTPITAFVGEYEEKDATHGIPQAGATLRALPEAGRRPHQPLLAAHQLHRPAGRGVTAPRLRCFACVACMAATQRDTASPRVRPQPSQCGIAWDGCCVRQCAPAVKVPRQLDQGMRSIRGFWRYG